MDFKRLARIDAETVSKGMGKLAIHFEKMSHNSVPITGCGIYATEVEEKEQRHVVFFITWSSNYQDIATGNISYTLYEMDPESQKAIYAEHERYEAEIGFNRTYGLKPNVQLFRSGKQMSRFVHTVRVSELNGKPLCNIDYKQIVNPIPYMDIPENISRAAVANIVPKAPGSGGSGLCPNAIAQIVSSASNSEFHWQECEHVSCLEGLVSIILEDHQMSLDERELLRAQLRTETSSTGITEVEVLESTPAITVAKKEEPTSSTYADKRQQDIYTLDENSNYNLKLTITLSRQAKIQSRYDILRPALLKGGIHYLDRGSYHIVSREALAKNDEVVLQALRDALSTYKK